VFTVQTPATGGCWKLSNPTQFPDVHALFELQPVPLGEPIAPGSHAPETQCIVNVQSSEVLHWPPACVLAMQTPSTQANEQQPACSLQPWPTVTQLAETGSTDGSPLIRQPATDATASEARRSFFMVGLR
jgi:hypothetical protein